VLAARVRALLRRASATAEAARAIVRFGPFSLDVEGYLLRRDDERIPLSAKEFEKVMSRSVAWTEDSLSAHPASRPLGVRPHRGIAPRTTPVLEERTEVASIVGHARWRREYAACPRRLPPDRALT